MPVRLVREGILTSERVNSLSPNAELFYRRLMSVVDDYGRFSANPTLLRASCYPLKLDSVKEDSISKHLAECVGARLIVLYTVAGKAFLEMQDFNQRIQSKSKYPDPTDADAQVTEIQLKAAVRNRVQPSPTESHGDSPLKTALDGVVVGDEFGDEDESSRPTSPKAQPDPEDDRLARWMFDLIAEAMPGTKPPNFTKWANTVRLMRERDGLTHRRIAEVFAWANHDSFWQANIQSPDKLRDKFPQLAAKMAQPSTTSASRAPRGNVLDSMTDRSWAEDSIQGDTQCVN